MPNVSPGGRSTCRWLCPSESSFNSWQRPPTVVPSLSPFPSRSQTPRRGQIPLRTTQLTNKVPSAALALFLRNTRPYLLPLLRRSHPTPVGRAFSSGRDEIPFRSPAGPGAGNGESSGKGRFKDEGITAFFTVDNHTPSPRFDIEPRKELEEDEDGFDYENANYGLARENSRMAQDIMVTFLGTSSGGGPTRSRNCSSLVVDMLGDGTLWSACFTRLNTLAHARNRHRISLISSPPTPPIMQWSIARKGRQGNLSCNLRNPRPRTGFGGAG